jgi:hypothetical protein
MLTDVLQNDAFVAEGGNVRTARLGAVVLANEM